MTAEELLTYLTHQGIELWIDGDNLRYRGRKITLPPGLVALLRQHKAQLRELLLTNRQGNKDLLPLSYTQKSMWFLHQLNPSSSAYNVHAAAKLTGAFSAPALQAALDKLGARHHGLRIRYVVRDGLPWQQVEATPSIRLTEIDASAWTEAELVERVRADAYRPYDLLGEPPARVFLYQRSPTEQVLLIGLHHIRVDGWSMAILVRELGLLYRSEISGEPAQLPAVGASFADFVAWQQWLVQGSEGSTQLAYWMKELGGELPTLELPTDRPRPPVRSERGGELGWSLDEQSSRRLRSLAAAQGTTPFSLFLSAFAVFLHRYTGQDDLLIGTPYHGRSMTRWNDVVGCLINTIVLRLRPRGDQSFLSLLREVHKKASEALTHADHPFPLLVETLRPERDLSRTPLFQVLFAYKNFQGADAVASLLSHRKGAHPEQLFGPDLDPIPLAQQEGQFDLTLRVQEDGDRFSGSCCFSTDLFEHATAERMLAHFERLLRSALEQPHSPVAMLTLLSHAERQRVLFGRNPEPPPPHAADTFPHRFLAQVERTPDNLALSFGGQSLTYRDLCKSASQVAHLLCACGIGPESRVAICLDRSLDLVIGIVAIWLSGGVYVPLDPQLPRERTEYQLQDSGATVLLTQRRYAERLSAPGLRVVLIDDEAASTRPTTTPHLSLSPHQPAYCIYTSGSTGRPRGVIVEHGSLIHLSRTLHAALLPPSVGPLRATLNANVIFDASIKMLTLLLRGDSIHVVPAAARGDAAELVAWSRAQRIDLIDCTPSILTELVTQGLFSQEEHVPAWLWIGGEAIPEKLWTQLRQEPRTRSINLYGPTECTVDSTVCEIGRGPERPVIGRPFGNVRTYVLDAQRQPVPDGVFGELYLSGPGVARGYLNQPILTAEKFLSDPFHPGERMYRTGDQARFLPDGNIEFLGRLDSQVKLRGFRIELGEIESVLSSHSAIQRCAVLLREDSPGDKRLVAYFVPSSGASPDVQTLRSSLATRLPEYMLPASFVRMDSLPLNSSGKLDRRALPPPPLEGNADGPHSLGSPIEQLLVELFREVLRREHIPLSSSFFDLGGHSLLAMQLVSRLRKLCDIELPVQAVFESPSLVALAERVRTSLAAGLAPLPPIRALGPRTQVPMSFSQQRLWLLQALDPASCTYNIPMQWRLTGSLDVSALARCLDSLAQRHEVLRSLVVPDPLEPRLQIMPLGHWPLQRAEVTSASDAELVLRAQALRPFALDAEPPVRAVLVRLSDTEHWLQLNVHHMAFDGWSRPLLLRELTSLYESERTGAPAALPPLELRYADYADAQRDWLASGLRDSQLAYWRKELLPLPPPLELPTDRTRPARPSGAGAWSRLTLEEETTSSLKTLCRHEGVTPFMALLAAYAITLSRYTGQTDFAIGAPIAGRPHLELEPIVGCFINTLVLRADLSGSPSFLDVLKRIKEEALGAYAHAELPFEVLVEELNPPRDTGRSPLFQVMFHLQNAEQETLRLTGLRAEEHQGGSMTAKFDLTLGMRESSGSLSGLLEYSTDLFDADTIERFARHFCNIVRSAIADPKREVSRLELLSQAERHLLLSQWNDTHSELPTPLCIHQLFEAQALRSPDSVAVLFSSSSLTYRELDRRADLLAQHLLHLGVGPDTPVALCMSPSLELIISLLAVLKAGGAYVPIDPHHPPERISFMLNDARPAALLVDASTAESIPVTQIPVLRIPDALTPEHSVKDSARLQRPRAEVSPHHLVYIIYTSGSTGRPKGVCVEHRSLANLLSFSRELFGFRPADLVLSALSFAFDPFGLEVWLPLVTGARLVLSPAGTARDSVALSRLYAESRPNLFIATPSGWQALLDAGWQGDPSLQIISGGEAISPELADALSSRTGAAWNLYGPTETTVLSTFQRLCPGERPITIGRPIANTQIYILDSLLQPTPIGVHGEIFIGGIGLARGYLNLPERTSQSFLPNPFTGDKESPRLYKTGDRGRFLPDGTIEFLGRLDSQVKLRGFRIELGEIESVLSSHSAVQSCAVLLREDSPGNPRLCAYVALNSGAAPEPSELRAHLSSKLPSYMIPSAFVFLDSLPTNANGKLDRKALPPPSDAADARGQVAPRTELEHLVATAFAQVLGLQRAGIHDSFFELGGHSLLALRLTAEIGRLTGHSIPLSFLFEHPTVAELAQELEEEAVLPSPKTLVLLHPAERSVPLFCVHPAGGHVLCYVELASSFQPPQRVYGVQATPVAQGASAEALDEVASRYVTAIRSVQPHGPYQLLGWSLGGVLAFEMARQLKRAGEEVWLLALLDSYAPEPVLLQDAAACSEAEAQRWFLRNLTGERLSESDAEPSPEDVERLQRALDHAPSMESPRADRYGAQLAALYALFRRNIEMERRYHPGSYDGRVLLLRAAERPTPRSRDCGWAALCTGELEIVDVPGDHYTLLSPAHVPGLQRLLGSRLIPPGGSPR